MNAACIVIGELGYLTVLNTNISNKNMKAFALKLLIWATTTIIQLCKGTSFVTKNNSWENFSTLGGLSLTLVDHRICLFEKRICLTLLEASNQTAAPTTSSSSSVTSSPIVFFTSFTAF